MLFRSLALRLAREPGLLADLRRRLIDGRAAAPLFDTDRTRLALERAYETMWDKWMCGEPPRSFAVD